MPIQRLRPGECIFCTFRLPSRPVRQHPNRIRNVSPTSSSSSFSYSASASSSAASQRAGPAPSKPPIRRVRNKRPPGKDWTSISPIPLRRIDSTDQDVRRPFGNDAMSGFQKNRFKVMVLDRLEMLEPKFRDSPVFKQPGLTDVLVDKALAQFRWFIRENLSYDNRKRDLGDLHRKLFDALKDGGYNRLDSELQYALYNHFLGRNFSPEDIENQRALADMRYPTEWYPEPREVHRTIHAHIGPTNSGKTYHALQRLEQAQSGLYAGPLRLLAHEVYSRLNARGKLCALVTGEEQRIPNGWRDSDSKVVAATVEMANLGSIYDVVVIDEIQMLGNLERGFAWSQALLGLQSKEIHVCGEQRALPIIRELAAAAGDKLVVHQYDRLTKLTMDDASLNGSLKSLRKGDCIVTFSVVNIHALRTEVEKKTGKKAAVVYGSLPPETRAQQARLFNDPDNDYDFLIASDAVGMGLNLSIKRVIFETVHKFHGGKLSTLSVSEIRQIAGRAGRYRTSRQAEDAAREEKSTADAQISNNSRRVETALTSEPRIGTSLDTNGESSSTDVGSGSSVGSNTDSASSENMFTRAEFDNTTVGLVTTIDSADFDVVKQALETEPPPLTFATIQPPPGIVQRFASYFPPGTPFSYILVRLTELSNTTHRYKIYHKPEMVMMADLIHGIEGLSTEDRMIFINAPASVRDRTSKRAKLLKELARCIGDQRGGEILTLRNLPLEVLDAPTAGNKTRLKDLEELHKGLVLYLWLSFRFPGVFTQRPLGNFVKELVEKEIEETLKLMTFTSSTVRRERMRQRSKVEEEIIRALSEESMAARDQNKEVAEPGFESPSGDEVLGEEAETPDAINEIREQMPEDDEGGYPDEDLDAEKIMSEDEGTAEAEDPIKGGRQS